MTAEDHVGAGQRSGDAISLEAVGDAGADRPQLPKRLGQGIRDRLRLAREDEHVAHGVRNGQRREEIAVVLGDPAGPPERIRDQRQNPQAANSANGAAFSFPATQ